MAKPPGNFGGNRPNHNTACGVVSFHGRWVTAQNSQTRPVQPKRWRPTHEANVPERPKGIVKCTKPCSRDVPYHQQPDEKEPRTKRCPWRIQYLLHPNLRSQVLRACIGIHYSDQCSGHGTVLTQKHIIGAARCTCIHDFQTKSSFFESFANGERGKIWATPVPKIRKSKAPCSAKT